MRVDGVRYGFRSKDTSHFSSHITPETVGGDGRGVFRSQTSHYSSQNPGGHCRSFHISGSYIHVDDIIHDNKRGDSRGDGERRGSRSQDIFPLFFYHLCRKC